MIILTPCPKKRKHTPKTPKRVWGWEPLKESRTPSLLRYCSPAGLVSQERKQEPVPGWTLPIVEAAEFGKPNPTISLPLSAEIRPPHPPACTLGFICRQLCFGALLRREGTATSTGRRGMGKRRNTAQA